MSDHDDLLARAERNAGRLRRLAAANQEDFLKHSPEFEGEDLRGVAAPELDGADSLDDLAAALRSVEADRDHWKANHADKVHKSRETARLLREARARVADLDAEIEDAWKPEVRRLEDRIRQMEAKMSIKGEGAEIARLRATNERLLKDAKAHAKRARNANRKARTEQENAARLAAERDELREVVRRAADGQETGDVIADPKFWGRLYSDAINGWRDTSRAVLTKIAEGGTPADVVEVIGEFIDEYVASDDDTAALFNRAKTKAES